MHDSSKPLDQGKFPVLERIDLVGAGGVGYHLATALGPLVCSGKLGKYPTVCIHDGDDWEDRNFERVPEIVRERFDEEDGPFTIDNKAESLGRLFPRVRYYSAWFTPSTDIPDSNLILCCVDNHPARLSCLLVADREQIPCIIGANEYTDCEAYIYLPHWKGTKLDPRVYYPEILTVVEGDPRQAETCTNAATNSPQLSISNHMAASMMLHLFWFWFVERPKMERDSEPYWPVLQRSNFNTLTTLKVGDMGGTK